MSVSNPAAANFESFEEVVSQAQATSNFKPLWNRFVKTKFYVAISRGEFSAESDFEFVTASVDDSHASIRVSEYKDRVPNENGAEIVRISGAEIVRRAPDGVGICLCLTARPLEIAAVRVEWLKKSLEASRQALIRKKAAANAVSSHDQAPRAKTGDTLPPINAISMPLPSNELAAVKAWDFRVSALPVEASLAQGEKESSSPVPAFSYESLELLPVQPAKKSVVQFDASSIKSRHVTHAGLGMELFVPAGWQDIRNEKAIKFVDHASSVIIEVNGRKRDDLNLDTWMEMRIPLVTQEMPSLVLTRQSEEIQGRNWKGQISGKVTEFRGRMNGDEVDTIYQICCIQTAKRLIAICIRAHESKFEEQRALLKWMVEGVEAYEMLSKDSQDNIVNTYQTSNYTTTSSQTAPSPFSLSFAGRIGRLRFIVYSMMSIMPMIVVAILAPLLVKDIGLAILIGGVIFFFVMLWRPLALRLHDLNLSGKWILLAFVGPVIASVAHRPDMLVFGQVVTSIGYLLLLILPGSSGDNEYGSPCPPNPIWVSVLAYSFIALMVVGNVGYYKLMRNQGALFANKGSASSNKSGYGFSPANQTFTINFPVMPVEDANVASAMKGPGVVESHMYNAEHKKFQYMVQEVVLNKVPPDRSMALDKFSEFFSSRIGGEVLESKKTMQGSYAARAVRIRIATGYQDFRFLFVGNTLFVLGAQSPLGSDNAQEADDFFDSFQAN